MVARTARVLALCAVATSGCVTLTGGKVRPGFIDVARSSRDPDPTLDPTRNLDENVWMPESERSLPADGSREELAQTIAATFALLLVGVVPRVILTLRFDENRLFDPGARRTTATKKREPKPTPEPHRPDDFGASDLR